MNKVLIELIEELPETYQPIFGHPELTYNFSRTCDDRLIQITKQYRLLEKELKRPLNVLDLGCAQGFFSLSLAKIGAKVQGIDFLDKNIAVCKALANENDEFDIKFDTDRIENIICDLEKEYDMVLGLSVFHHIVHEHGLSTIQEMISKLAKKVKIGIFELALYEEPLYWGKSQAKIPYDLLKYFSFVHELDRYPTHLSHFERPIVVASNFYWFLNNQIGSFDSFCDDSHQLAKGTHQLSRRYYFSENLIVKTYKLNNNSRKQINLREYSNEVEFLTKHPNIIKGTNIILHGMNTVEAWIVREKIEGELLLDLIINTSQYDSDIVIMDILEQLVSLESIGMYHNDLRVWNILINKKGHAILIDYGSISEDPTDSLVPNNLFLSFIALINEIELAKRVDNYGFLGKQIFDINLLDGKWKNAFAQLFLLPKEKISFHKLQELILLNKSDALFPSGIDILQEANNQILSKSNNIIKHYKVKISQTETKLTQTERRLVQTETKLTQTERRLVQTETKLTQTERILVQTETKLTQTERRLVQTETKLTQEKERYKNILNSNSWKIMKPLRLVGKAIRWFIRGVKAWITFSQGSRPRRIIKALLRSLKFKITGNERIKVIILSVLSKFPRLKISLARFVNADNDVHPIEKIDVDKVNFLKKLKKDVEKYKQDRMPNYE